MDDDWGGALGVEAGGPWHGFTVFFHKSGRRVDDRRRVRGGDAHEALFGDDLVEPDAEVDDVGGAPIPAEESPPAVQEGGSSGSGDRSAGLISPDERDENRAWTGDDPPFNDRVRDRSYENNVRGEWCFEQLFEQQGHLVR